MKERTAGGLVIFSFGFFPLFAQALLFRSFLTTFAGHEFAVGCFFGSWLLWLGVGAVACRVWQTRATRWLRHFEWLLLLYLPAFLVQQALLLNARPLAGVEVYEVFPILEIAAFALAANAPISLLTGFLFALACAWATRHARLPLARVYALESLGSFAGGAAITLMLTGGLSEPAAFLTAATALLLVAAAASAVRGARAVAAAAALLALACGAALAAGAGPWWVHAHGLSLWNRRLPGGHYAGRFVTPQASYAYGGYGPQLEVLAGESICETVPDLERASQVVAAHLAQKPDARSVLVIGPGAYAIGSRFLDLPGTRDVTWLHSDPDYPAALLRALPDRLRQAGARLHLAPREIRAFLRDTDRRYDLVLVTMPDATSLSLNRYLTSDFFALIRSRLAPGGVLSVRVAGGENYLGGELAQLGASVYLGLQTQFRQVAIKPGDESWLMASDSPVLSEDAAELATRWRTVADNERLYPVEGLAALYPADRIQFQTARYKNVLAAGPRALLLNTDDHPRGLLFGLLVAARQAGAGPGLDLLIRSFSLAGLRVAFAAFVILLILRGAYRAHSPSPPAGRPFDAGFLVFSTGFTGMALSVLLMFEFQVRFGSLALQAGLLSALFMLGLYLGSRAGEGVAARSPAAVNRWLAGCLLAHLLFIAGLTRLPPSASHLVFYLLLAGCGILTGCYVPVAAVRLPADGNAGDLRSGVLFVLLDNMGGALGGLAVALLLVPTLGTVSTLLALGLLVALNVFSLAPARATEPEPAAGRAHDEAWRAAGYALFGLAAFIWVASLMLRSTDVAQPGPRLLTAARAMLQNREIRLEAPPGTASGEPPYYRVLGTGDVTDAFVFSTAPYARDARGYGGRLVLAALVQPDGTLRALRVMESHETPSYLARVRPWLESLSGRNVFRDEWAGVDGVSGATITSAAILKTLRQAGSGFAAALQGQPRPPAATRGGRVDRGAVYVLILLALAWTARRAPRLLVRRALLLSALVVCGLHLNAQYSLDQVFALLALEWPEPGVTLPLVMILVIPVVVLLAGNVYCGYLCPFGALQELIGDLGPRAWQVDPHRTAWRVARFLKYVVLFAAVVWFAIDGRRELGAADPLVTLFSAEGLARPSRLALFLLACSFFFPRIWCRALCPAGAFLSILNGARLLRPLIPLTQPARCRLGVQRVRDLDCLHCDRCRMAQPDDPAAAPGRRFGGRDVVFLLAVAGGAAALAREGLSVRRALTASRGEGEAAVRAEPASSARPADLRAIQALIERGQLSSHPARFAKEYVAPPEE